MILNNSKCVGCSACMAICPTNAITMSPDEKGFLYPIIDKKLCVECGQCKNVCLCLLEKSNLRGDLQNIEYYLAKLNNVQEIQYCQSGGVSYGIAKEILNKGGIVYGCVYENNVATHVRISKMVELRSSCGSKYVQSDLKDVYREIYNDLRERKTVLFTGTSCYVEGLYLYLEKKACSVEQLYTADIICHGVPSPLILADFIKYVEKNNNSKVKCINLRNRKYAPKLISTIQFQNGVNMTDVNYLDLFYTNLTIRDSCFQCQFTTRNKPADITMADTTGIVDKYKNQLQDTSPSSMVIVRTQKGKSLLKQAELDLVAVKDNEFDQYNLNYPSKQNMQKQKFWKEYKEKGFDYVFNKYTYAGGTMSKFRRKFWKLTSKWK